MQIICGLAICMLASACAGKVDVPAVAPANAAAVQTATSLLAGSVVLGRAEGLACSGFLGGLPPASDALAALKAQAASMGATHVYRVRYATVGVISQCRGGPGRRATAIAFRR